MIQIDGSRGEGGGQILRSSLALSLATGQAFRIDGIRAGRKKPGLMRQHLTAVRAAAEVGRAELEGDRIGSTRLRFAPRGCRGGDYAFAVGTAGSATLVLQTVLPALCLASSPSSLVLEGGTHNPWSPPFDFLDRAFLPLVGRMGPRIRARLIRHGFYPAGGGRFELEIEPVERIEPLVLCERGEIRGRRVRALCAGLPAQIGERETARVVDKLGWDPACVSVEEIRDSAGPGNILLVEIECTHLGEVFCGFGQRGVKAEAVADAAVAEIRDWLAAGVPVGPHLADQLMLPIALAGSGRFRTLPLSRHSSTNLDVIGQFVELDARVEEIDHRVVEVELRADAGQGSGS
ncbi:MAG: RNA 3'-terminal phosphate cyclase [Deltaproteobacteria bacterium]|nr:RNA 3'-terminal phosphate cyclase [Deltaproteobacteria bacterium]